MASRGHQLLHADALAAELEALGLDSSLFGIVGIPAPVFQNLIPRRAGVWDTDPNTHGFSDFSGAFTRASTALYRDESGKWQTAAANVLRSDHDANGNFLGMLFEPESTNKCENYNANPDVALSNITTTLPGGVTLERVADVAELAAAGFENICTDGNVLKVDNSGGASTGYVAFDGVTGNTNTHSASVVGRASAGTLKFSVRSDEADLVSTNSASYIRLTSNGLTPDATNNELTIKIEVGSVVYFILNQLEEKAVVTSPIVTLGASSTRAVDATQWPLSGNQPGAQILSNPQLDNTATGWTIGACGGAAGDGFIRAEAVTSATCELCSQGPTVIDDRRYLVEVDIDEIENGDIYVVMKGGTNSDGISTAGKHYLNVLAGSAGTAFQINMDTPVNMTVQINNLKAWPLSPFVYDTEGMIALIWRPGFDDADLVGTGTMSLNLVQFKDSFLRPIFFYKNLTTGQNVFFSHDGSSFPSVTISGGVVANREYLVALRWAGTEREIGFKANGSWTWGTAGSYDGSWGSNTELKIPTFVDPWAMPVHIHNVLIWDQDEGTAFLQSLFDGVAE